MNPEIQKLRAERLQREAKRAGVAAPAKTAPKTPVLAAPKAAPKSATAPAPATDVLTAPVVDITTISKSASFNVDLYGAGSENPHWLVVADGRPLGEIQLADQDPALVDPDMFTADSFGTSVHRALTLEGPKVLANLKCRVYQASVAKSVLADSLRKEITASADSSVRVARSELRANMMNVLGLVLKAHTKNVIAGNDLKHELFTQMKGIGMDDRTAAHVIEAAWQNGANAYFDSCFAQAEEWMDMPADAYNALAKQIDNMPHRSVEPVAAAADVPSEAHNIVTPEPRAPVTASVGNTDYSRTFAFGRVG